MVKKSLGIKIAVFLWATEAIDWRRDIKNIYRAWFKRTFPGIHRARDEAKYYKDIANCDISTEAGKSKFILQSIKTDFGKEKIAKDMCAPIRNNLRNYTNIVRNNKC